jgi:hypothetical protein
LNRAISNITINFFRPENGIAMGSPISGTLAEIYLQLIEKLYIKHWIESQEIIKKQNENVTHNRKGKKA